MKHSLKFFAVAAVAVLLATPAAFAQNMPITPEASILPVTEPLDFGGTILQPGTYLIRVIPAADGRNKLQVMSRDAQKVYAMALSVPHYLRPSETVPNTTFVFFPATADHPRALRTWFAQDPPGDHGHDLVYPEGRAKQLAIASNERVVSYPDTTTIETSDTTSPSLSVVTPQSTVETYTYTPPTTVVETTTVEQRPMTSSSSDNMPSTAGTTPLFALLGIIAIAGAIAIRFVRA